MRNALDMFHGYVLSAYVVHSAQCIGYVCVIRIQYVFPETYLSVTPVLIHDICSAYQECIPRTYSVHIDYKPCPLGTARFYMKFVTSSRIVCFALLIRWRFLLPMQYSYRFSVRHYVYFLNRPAHEILLKYRLEKLT